MEIDNQKAQNFLKDFAENYEKMRKNFWNKRSNPKENAVLNGVKLLSSLDFQTKKREILENSKIFRRNSEMSPKKRESSSRISPKDRQKFKNLVNMAINLDQINKFDLKISEDDEDFEEFYPQIENENDHSSVYFSPIKLVSDSPHLQSPGHVKKRRKIINLKEKELDTKCYDIGLYYYTIIN